MGSDWTDRIRLRNLRFLLSLAQTRNLSHSAAALHTTQPGLSKWLKDLESDVGLTLFERHARGLTPTVHGQALIAHARRIEAQLDRAAADMNILREGGAGRVALGASGVAATEAGPLAVLEMAARMPTLRIDLVEGTMDLLLNLLSQGDLDIVIGRTMEDDASLAGFDAELLYTEPVDLAVRRDHPLIGRAEIGWDDVRQYRWVVWPRGSPIRKALETALAAAGLSLPPNYIESNSVIANIALLSNSDAIGVASHRSASALADMNLLRILPLKLQVFGSVSMYWRRDEYRPKAVELALDCIRHVLREPGAVQ
ncbi:LysR substrate-binding domain-containing protein [Castellaniella defragrans]|uniref:DNA-binding transcriptional LysR family regulator n=2 Tax=Castellaniella defragrans TaxID=75697 RepID=A0A7W9TQB4_CASDE|nr:LysR substrate-binding domain-containing protein [Castellaniella defragrans]KAB0620915.1 LysR family transcriptional regulator [Castellaniella defragrans]MBB6084749.1 DNA-binding transcriptional LysR family regulator [Castellaniella defragrans]CDM24508.1 Putative transcriptional regulator [Castellaniella defragrans 65Phen]